MGGHMESSGAVRRGPGRGFKGGFGKVRRGFAYFNFGPVVGQEGVQVRSGGLDEQHRPLDAPADAVLPAIVQRPQARL
eukprot:6532851-Pyramimonas_sp.AAC.2